MRYALHERFASQEHWFGGLCFRRRLLFIVAFITFFFHFGADDWHWRCILIHWLFWPGGNGNWKFHDLIFFHDPVEVWLLSAHFLDGQRPGGSFDAFAAFLSSMDHVDDSFLPVFIAGWREWAETCV